MNYGRRLSQCRMCDSKHLYEFLDLGFLPSADGILNKEEMKQAEVYFPLKVAQCQHCGLTQLTYAANPSILYGDQYKYEASITQTGRSHFKEMAVSIVNRFNFPKGSLAVDIGSNVGVLLEEFEKKGMKILGIDPAPKIAKIANDNSIETWVEFISPDIAKKIIQIKGKAKIVTCTNVFAHIDDKKGLMESLDIILDEDGILVIEAPYFLDLVKNLEYDTIYVDHLEYITIKPLCLFFEKYGMKIFDVQKQKMHGGTLRIFVCWDKVYEVNKRVYDFIDLEDEHRIYKKDTLDKFADRVKKHKKSFLRLLTDIKKEGKSIVGISAPAKGNTLLNYCKINTDIIDYMTEKAEIKIGHYTPGMHIPIVSEDRLAIDKPDYGIIFAWNFADEIMKNNQEFLDNGGKFIVPIPEPVIVSKIQNDITIVKISPVFQDGRGTITDLLNEKINHVGLIVTEKNYIRGNHYHSKSTQYSYILSGSFEVLTAKFDRPHDITTTILNQGDMIIIPPNVIHTFKALEKTVMIDMVSESRDGSKFEDDVFRIELHEKD